VLGGLGRLVCFTVSVSVLCFDVLAQAINQLLGALSAHGFGVLASQQAKITVTKNKHATRCSTLLLILHWNVCPSSSYLIPFIIGLWNVGLTASSGRSVCTITRFSSVAVTVVEFSGHF
jgi:hypothetical protein